MTILVMSLSGLVQAAALDLSDLPQEVKSITVGLDSVTVSFERVPEVIFSKAKNGDLAFLERQAAYTVKLGENLGWGDGDHVSASIVLNQVSKSTASLTLIREHRPPATHAALASVVQGDFVIEKAYYHNR